MEVVVLSVVEAEEERASKGAEWEMCWGDRWPEWDGEGERFGDCTDGKGT